jgi:hypothetical protein
LIQGGSTAARWLSAFPDGCPRIGVKAEIYAENGAPEYWIVDLASRSVFVHTDPERGSADR